MVLYHILYVFKFKSISFDIYLIQCVKFSKEIRDFPVNKLYQFINNNASDLCYLVITTCINYFPLFKRSIKFEIQKSKL